MKVVYIVCTVLVCISAVFSAILTLMEVKWYNYARKIYEDKLEELEEEGPEDWIINDGDLPTETCTNDWFVGNSDA